MLQPSVRRPKTSTMWFRYLVEAIHGMGLDGLAIARAAGMDTTLLMMPEAVLPDELTFVMMRLATQQSGNANFGLQAASSFKPTALGALSYSMMTAENLDGALNRAVRYGGSLSQASSARLRPLGRGKRFDIVLESTVVSDARQTTEFVALFMLEFLRWIVGRELNPLAVRLPHAAPADTRLHDALFRCPVAFEGECISMDFSREQLAMPLITADASLAAVHDRHAEERMRRFGEGPYSQQVHRLIARTMPDGEPSRRDIAELLAVTERTLQRRLQAEGTRFADLLEAVRQNMAELHLANRDMTLHEVACLLGYSEQSSFTRATHRWFKLTPSEARNRLIDQQARNSSAGA